MSPECGYEQWRVARCLRSLERLMKKKERRMTDPTRGELDEPFGCA